MTKEQQDKFNKDSLALISQTIEYLDGLLGSDKDDSESYHHFVKEETRLTKLVNGE